MRKCVSLEDEPGFQQINSPILTQAIDRGLMGHSGTGVVDWGYNLPTIRTRPLRGKTPLLKIPPEANNTDHYKVPNSVQLGSNSYFDYLFNTYGTPEMRALINKYPPIPIKIDNTGGHYAPWEGTYGTVHSSKGKATDLGTLFHEYGHALDNMIGNKSGANDALGQSLAYSEQFVLDFLEDGKKLGLVIDNSAYFNYIIENGLSFRLTTRGRRFNVRKGLSKEEIEARMKPGDHWRIMEYLLKKVKEDLHGVNNTKNPDPVKVKRAEEVKNNIEKLYDQHLKRIKTVKKIMNDVIKARKIDTSKVDQLWYEGGSIADIIDALTGGEIFDYEKAVGESVLYAGHPSGYYSNRQTGGGYVRNHTESEAAKMRRVEIWAQFFQFIMYQDKTTYNLVKKLMPQAEKKFALLIKKAKSLKLDVDSITKNNVYYEDLVPIGMV
jgi:hypothetical protein